MTSEILSIRKSLNKAFLKVKPNRSQIELLKSNLQDLFHQINESESEEYHKNLIAEFLKKTYSHPNHYINTKGRADLVIHNGKDSKSSVGVIIETKRPGNKAEMPIKDNINTKAVHELVLYYLRERITQKNLEIKHLIATDLNEWYVFNAQDFEKIFAKNKKFVKDFEAFEDGRLSVTKTEDFYSQIVQPFIDEQDISSPVSWFDIRDFESFLGSEPKENDNKLIGLYKILSPEHLLKLPFVNDSNTLDKKFYNELLHIIGLEERKEKSKKLIERKSEKSRDNGSFIENAINILRYEDCLNQLEKPSDYGSETEEQLFHVALELSITWINRILFLKLLEGQLVRYHQGDTSNKFLDPELIPDYDTLNKLFFHVLAVKETERGDHVKDKFRNIPYLNSSLFEPNELEHKTIRISNLEDYYTIPILSSTVLKDSSGKKISGRMNPLHYLLNFLDAYDFSSEGAEDISEENKTLINASVLGLIFEKINGYKDGSFFTPGFITMYMCRETIRRAVVQKFNESKGLNCETLDDLYNHIDDKKEANEIINSLKICDPAVGSGHFLVSALNEILAIKSELKILSDAKGKVLRDYNVEVINDELVITDEDGEFFEYHPKNPESQRIQETFFREKQTIIENCLFGVDINQNSVKICRLRLWIELLKNAYYRPDSGFKELETLPNIDINIKCGNSLISRYPLDVDIRRALAKSKWSIDSYRLAVMTYRNAENKEQKHEIIELINQIKADFEVVVALNDKRLLKLNRLKGELMALTSQTSLFELSKKKKGDWDRKVNKISDELNTTEKELEEIKDGKIFDHSFEWRFEFPEVLNDEGDFIGFDAVIGNPPYFPLSKIKHLGKYFESEGYKTYSKSADIYCLFYERGSQILKDFGIITYITSNSWLKSIYGDILKDFFINEMHPLILINIEDIQIFEEATVESDILTLQKKQIENESKLCNISQDFSLGTSLSQYVEENHFKFDLSSTTEWYIKDQASLFLKEKIKKNSKLLKELDIEINRGFLTGFNKAFIVNSLVKDELISLNHAKSTIVKPILRGRDIAKYNYKFADLWAICTFPSLTIDINEYVSIKNYLLSFGQDRLEQSGKSGARKKTNNKWFETQDSISYWREFKKPKIVWGEISDIPKFAYDDENYYVEATSFIMTGGKLKYLLAILNSRVSEWYFNQISTTTGMGTNRWKKYKIELLPVKQPSKLVETKIENLVDQLLHSRKIDPDNKDVNLENELDKVIYSLYGLNKEDIEIIEKSTSN